MHDAKRKLAIALAILATGYYVGAFAYNVKSIWVAWFLTVGFFAASALAPQMSRVAVTICLLATTSVALTIAARTLPIYELNWKGADQVEISRIADDWKILLTDPNEIESLMEFGNSGHYESIMKSGDLLHIYVTHGNTTIGYYIHGDSVGPCPGGFSQTVFVPQRKGMRSHLDALIASRGISRELP